MGCAFGKDASPAPSSASLRREKERAARPIASDRKSQAALSKIETAAVDAPAAAAVRVEKAERLAGERPHGRRRQRADPRLGNPPGHVHGEQVAAGWPSWLSIVAGEAIKGWTPRRADTFEKLAKASIFMLPLPHFLGFLFVFLSLNIASFLCIRLDKGLIAMFTKLETHYQVKLWR